ncbi:MAG TPA: VTT domain-containing protein [Anaerolineales bacterium]|nr:VTT domain-containing protein [Anaerolineales bacterium]HNA89587.1 VTT domain-containing protein [Anaerolineales bacterium]HNB37401.1 VTT domain-containing protein [Anaerolineales bacterium]
MSDFLLTQVINYGAPLFALTLFLGALGLPVGASVMVIAMGAFIQQGYFEWSIMAALGLVGAVLGDGLSFGIGHYGKGWVTSKITTHPAWTNALSQFNHRAGAAIFLTRFLITALAIPTNLIAGSSGYSFRRFMFYDILGEMVWIVSYGGLGYLFGSQWELVSEFLSNFGGLLLGIVVFIFGLRQAWTWQTKKQQRV